MNIKLNTNLIFLKCNYNIYGKKVFIKKRK